MTVSEPTSISGSVTGRHTAIRRARRSEKIGLGQQTFDLPPHDIPPYTDRPRFHPGLEIGHEVPAVRHGKFPNCSIRIAYITFRSVGIGTCLGLEEVHAVDRGARLDQNRP